MFSYVVEVTETGVSVRPANIVTVAVGDFTETVKVPKEVAARGCCVHEVGSGVTSDRVEVSLLSIVPSNEQPQTTTSQIPR